MAKKIKSKEAGYVPFTRDDINHEDGRNSRAEQLFLELLDIPKRVIKKKKKGKEENIVDDDFYPTSMDEVQRMEGIMVQVEAAIDDHSDTEFMDNVAYMKDILAWSKKRHWNFAWWIVICVAIVAVYFFVTASNQAEKRDEIKNWTEETLKTRYNDYLNTTKRNVEYWEGQMTQASDEATKKRNAESLEYAQNQLKEQQENGVEGFQEMMVQSQNRRAWATRGSALWCLIWIVLYIVAERPRGYMLSKRRIEMKVYRGLRKALFWVAGVLVGMAGALQVTETITTWSNGSKTRESDAMPIMFLKLGLLLAAVLLVLVTARIVIVIATIMGFIRNYDLIAMAKQTFSKGKELTAENKVK
jgi:hypothetical protein